MTDCSFKMTVYIFKSILDDIQINKDFGFWTKSVKLKKKMCLISTLTLKVLQHYMQYN